MTDYASFFCRVCRDYVLFCRECCDYVPFWGRILLRILAEILSKNLAGGASRHVRNYHLMNDLKCDHCEYTTSNMQKERRHKKKEKNSEHVQIQFQHRRSSL